jgi:restriction system protein
MTDITLQRTAEFLRVVIDALWSKPDGLPAGEILTKIRASVSLMGNELDYLPSTNIPRYEQLTRLAVNPLVEAGWFIKNKERWYLTDDGKAACKNFLGAEEFYKAALQVYDHKRQLRDTLSVIVEEAQEKAWVQVWRYLQEMNAVKFKNMIADLLQALGYHVDWIAPPGKSRGHIDMIAYSGAVAGPGPRIKVFVRHTGQQATVEGLRAFVAVLTTNDAGIFVSSGGFTELVREEVRAPEFQKVRLISIAEFFDLWVENYEKLSQEGKRRFPIKAVYFVTPEV